MASKLISIAFVLSTTIICSIGQNSQILFGGETLRSGQSLQCGKLLFIMQEDCNLVLYDNSLPVWASQTRGVKKTCLCKMQSDGDLVIYANGLPIWHSDTDRGEGLYALVLQKDRNVVIYGNVLWSTRTSVPDYKQVARATISSKNMTIHNQTNIDSGV